MRRLVRKHSHALDKKDRRYRHLKKKNEDTSSTACLLYSRLAEREERARKEEEDEAISTEYLLQTTGLLGEGRQLRSLQREDREHLLSSPRAGVYVTEEKKDNNAFTRSHWRKKTCTPWTKRYASASLFLRIFCSYHRLFNATRMSIGGKTNASRKRRHL